MKCTGGISPRIRLLGRRSRRRDCPGMFRWKLSVLPWWSELLPAFDMLEPGVKDFFDAVQFRSPQVPHVIEAIVNGAELGVHESDQDADHGGVEQQRNADG